MVLYFWSPSQQTLYVFFIVVAVWGLADGLLITQIVSKYQRLFGTLRQTDGRTQDHSMIQSSLVTDGRSDTGP